MASHYTAPTAAVPDAEAVQSFFELLYGGAHDGYLVLSCPDPMQLLADGKHPWVSRWYDLAQQPWSLMAQEACNASAKADVYYGVVLQSPNCTPHRGKRSQTATAYSVPGFYADLDLAYGKHQASALPQSDEELLDFLHTFPTIPSLIVHSGGGMYPFWLFEQPLLITNPEELRAARHLCERFGRTLLQLGKQRGWSFDNVSDLPRTLRPPGTINHKYDKLVQLLHESGLRYNPGDFTDWLVDTPPRPTRSPETGGEGISGLPDIKAVAEHYGANFTKESQDELTGAHPIHGSATGGNFSINTTDQVWHCWRHGTGGNALHLVAVCEDLLQCEDAKSGGLRGKRFVKAVEHTNQIFGTSIPLRQPRWRAAQETAEDDQTHAHSNGHRPYTTGGPQAQDVPGTGDENPSVDDLLQYMDMGAASDANAHGPGQHPHDPRPDIIVSTHMTPIIDKTQEVIMALPHAPVVYQRARHLCIIARGVKPPQWLSRPKDMPVIVEATKAHLMELASKAAKWWKFDKRTQSHEPALPPAWAIEALLSTWTKVLPQFTLLENQSCISFQTVGESLGRVPIFPVNR